MSDNLIIIHEEPKTGGFCVESVDNVKVQGGVWNEHCCKENVAFSANNVPTWENVIKNVAQNVSGGYICNRLADGRALWDTPGKLFCRLQTCEEDDEPWKEVKRIALFAFN